jgi:hypothetical protein
MNKMPRRGILITLSFLLASCVQPVQYSAKDESFMRQDVERKPWRRIVVLPFTGDPAFRRVAAEWFAFQVRKHNLFEIIDPSLAEIELKKQGCAIGEADIAIEDARKAGRALGAEAVVVGSITKRPYPGGIGRWPVAGVSIVDVATGTVVATSIQSRILFTHDVHEYAMAAIERVAEDLIPVFYAAAGKMWTPPKKEERSTSETGVMP